MLKLHKHIQIVDDILARFQQDLGSDFNAYKNHCMRTINFASALLGEESPPVKICIASSFHDLGIWTDKTFDYLEPSIKLASDYLLSTNQAEWIPEVSSIIEFHHKLTSCDSGQSKLVETFRKADLIDVSLGIVAFGLPESFIREVKTELPNVGFHQRLVALGFRRLCTHPFSPMPMMKW